MHKGTRLENPSGVSTKRYLHVALQHTFMGFVDLLDRMNCDKVAFLELGNLGTDLRHAPDDLMAGHTRIKRVVPFAPRLVCRSE